MNNSTVERRRELDWFNAVSCLLVILIHVLSYGITKLDPTSWQYALVYVPHQMSAYVVPGFLFVGAVKMALSFPLERSYLPYILRRFLKIYIPYVIFNAIYYIAFIPIGYVAEFSFSELLRYTWNGTLSAQFYYVLIVMQFYILMPLWRWLTRRVTWYVGIFLSLFITILMTKADVVLGALGGSFGYFDRVFPTYLVFWVAGLYAGANYARVREALTKRRAQALCLTAVTLTFVYIVYLTRAKQIWIYDLTTTKIFSDLASITVLLCLCLWLEASRLERIKGLLRKIHNASYSVYLSHVLFLTLVTDRLLRHNISGAVPVMAARAVVCYTAPFLLYWLFSRIRALLKGRKKSEVSL